MDKDWVEGWMATSEEPAEFERAVRFALKRVDAPEGFAERVLARAGHRNEAGDGRGGRFALGRFWWPGWRLAYAAAALLAITAGSVRVEQVRMERRRTDAAAAQFSTAMEVTNRTLDKVTARLQQGEVGQFTKVLGSDR